jgi:hypothetical protein
MNDFSELENELRKLRPAPLSGEFLGRVEKAIDDFPDQHEATGKIVHPSRFILNWVSLGFGLAAAAAFLVFAHIRIAQTPKQTDRVAKSSPVPEARSTITSSGFIPTGATQVVYHTRDEGLHFPAWSEEPVRRVRYQKRETLQWRDPQTGASLRVSYPTEEVVLTPVSGQ